MQCAVCSVQCAVCSVQCAVCSVQCAVCSVQCEVFLQVRSVQLDPLEPILMPSPKKGSNNTYSEYFDNLLSLIDKAAKDLSL